MVYPGRPSHGCLACIARKVKCDEGKPECERCKKREQPCPGYRNPRDRKFVRMTGREKTASGASSETSASKQVEDPSFNRAPTPPPHQNFADQAVAFFFHQYIVGASENGNPGFLDFLPELYDLDRPDCALAHSIKAISYISLSAKSSVKVLAARGHEHYRLSLVRISHMLQSAEETAQDSLIVAIILIVLFENVTREKPAVIMSHAKGLHTLLLHRGEDQLRSHQGWAIFRHVNAHTLVRNIELSEYPSPETQPWLQGLDQSSPARHAIWEKHRISQVRAKAAETFSLPSNTPDIDSRLSSVLEEAQELDAEIQRWADNPPAPCRYQAWRLDSNGEAEKTTSSLAPTPEANEMDPTFSTQQILTYTDVWFASLWAGHRTSRLMLNETLITLARRLTLSDIAQEAIITISQILSATCASIAFSLGDVQVRADRAGHEFLDMGIDSRVRQGGGAGAYFIVWSLRHVVSCEFANESQIKTASEALVRIGAQFGVKQAFTLANRQYQCHPSLR